MLLIIVHHVSKHGGFYENATGATKIILDVADALFRPSVNIFVYVSAYLIIKKGQASLKNFLRLLIQIIFYSIVTYSIACLANFEAFSVETLFECFLPISYTAFWFSKAYLIMYIISPLLLKIVQNLKQKEYAITIFVLLLIIAYCTIFTNSIFLPFENGFNAIWFAVLFIFAGYQVRFGYAIKKYVFLIVYLANTVILYFIIINASMNVNYTNILVVLQTISLFNLVYDITIKNKICNKLISYISTCTFGVYMIHDSRFIQPYLYSIVFKTQNYYTLSSALLYFIMFVIIIFISGLIFESFRKMLFKGVSWLYNKIKKRSETGRYVKG